MLIGFPPIFMADTKMIYGYDFVAPLKMSILLIVNEFEFIFSICLITTCSTFHLK